MTINDAMAALVAELAAGEVPQPLAQRFTLATVWQDLARLAGETPPPAVAAVVDAALDEVCEPLAARRAVRAAYTAAAWLPAD